jgi:hypothetical protein
LLYLHYRAAYDIHTLNVGNRFQLLLIYDVAVEIVEQRI